MRPQALARLCRAQGSGDAQGSAPLQRRATVRSAEQRIQRMAMRGGRGWAVPGDRWRAMMRSRRGHEREVHARQGHEGRESCEKVAEMNEKAQ
jgi:hypothetical protein